MDCLEYERGMMKLCSVNYDGRIPMKGMENEFHEKRQMCEILQEMLQALNNEQVRMALADWQKELMTKGIQTELRFDEERYPEENLPDHKEEQRIPGGDGAVFDGPAVEQQPI